MQMDDVQPNDLSELSWAQGIFLELNNQEGTLGTPMWVSMREKAVLTKQINEATVYPDANYALDALRVLNTEVIGLGPNEHLVVAVRTYNHVKHSNFWRDWHFGQRHQLQDYSYYLTEVEQKLERLSKAMMNGPDNIAIAIARELNKLTLDLNLAIDRHFQSKKSVPLL